MSVKIYIIFATYSKFYLFP